MDNLQIGTIVSHFRYGEGVIYKVNLTNYEIIFERGGKMQMSKSNPDIELVQESQKESSEPSIKLSEVEEVMTYILDKYNGISHKVPMGMKWSGGTMTLQPANKDLKPKEIPIESFFHKIVMVRDRLRVLEQNINSHPKLSDEEKVNLQQYITRTYGSLTTFNVLFEEKGDYFVGQKGDE
jgi:hypothetical protein